MAPLRERLAREHLASPYARTPSANSPAARRAAPNTPGGLFSIVKTMFTPTTWLRDANKSVDNDDSLADFDESDSSVVSMQSATARAPLPSNPLDEFRTMRHQSSIQQMRQGVYSRASSESPNAKLAKFFATKGSDPLTEIEMEGVRALLTQSTSPVATPKARPHTTSFSQSEEEEEENITNESMVLKPDTSANSLLTATPSFKATYNDSMAGGDSEISISSNATPKRRVFDYSGFPSPYRSSRLKRSTFALNSEYEKSQKKLEEEESKKKSQEEPKPEKKMSNTATALLSFITTNETDDNTKPEETNEEEKKEVDFSNPYARKKSTRPSISKKPSPMEQLEKSLQAQSPAPVEKKQPVLMDKYRPAKSSSLRESVVANDDVEMEDEKTDERVEEKKEESTKEKPSFGFGNSAGFSGFGSKKTDESTSKPAYSFGSTTQEKKDEAAVTPAFSFGASSSTTSTAPPPPASFTTTATTTASTGTTTSTTTSTAKTFTFGASPSSSTTQPAFSFNSTAAAATTKDSDGDDEVNDESNLSLTIKHPQEMEPVNGHGSDPVNPVAISQFVFPGAEDLGFTLKDVDDSKVSVYRGLYTF